MAVLNWRIAPIFPRTLPVLILLLRLGTAVLGGIITAWVLGLGDSVIPARRSSRLRARRRRNSRSPKRLLRIAGHGMACSALCLLLSARSGAIDGDWTQAVLLTCLLYGIAVTDLRSWHVPLIPIFCGMAIRVAYLALVQPQALLPMTLGLLAGIGMLSLAALAYETIRGKVGLGAGDGAVLGLIGAFVGWQGLVPVLLGAALAGLIGGGGMLLLTRKPLGTPLPFAPFLAAGGWAVYAAQQAGWIEGIAS